MKTHIVQVRHIQESHFVNGGTKDTIAIAEYRSFRKIIGFNPRPRNISKYGQNYAFESLQVW